MEVHIAGNSTNLRTEASNLICKHAGGRDFDRIIPVVVVVAKGVREVQDGHLADLRRVFSDVEMRRLDRALGHRVRHKEEVKLAIDNLRLLNKASVDICTLRRVVNEVLTIVTSCLLEESLTDSLIHDD